MRIAVSGGAGFPGSHLCEGLPGLGGQRDGAVSSASS